MLGIRAFESDVLRRTLELDEVGSARGMCSTKTVVGPTVAMSRHGALRLWS